MLPRDNNDGRKRYARQAYDVSYFGKSVETGPSGYGTRLSGTPTALITLSADAGTAGTIVAGDLTQYLSIVALVNHVPLTSGTITPVLPAFNGEAEISLPAIDLTIGSVIFTGVDVGLPPLAMDRPLTLTVAGGTPGETAFISLMVCPIQTAWK